ncbi:MAG: hypothetical protein FD129_954, partial [bacterium]
ALSLPNLANTTRAAHTTTSFADVEPGPRIMAMGGAGTALADDPTGAWWNPAELYFMRGTRGVVTYDDLYGAGLAQRSYLSVAWKKVHYEPKFVDNRMTLEKDLGRGSAWGISVSSIFLDLGEESYSELMPSISFAAGLGGGVGIGSSVSFLKASSGVEDVGSSGYSASLGAGINLPARAHVGFVARNLLSSVSPEGGSKEKLRGCRPAASTGCFSTTWRRGPAFDTWVEASSHGRSRPSASGWNGSGSGSITR